MALKVKDAVSQEDLIFYEILRHPILFPEFLNNMDRREEEEEFLMSDYQVRMICDFNNRVSYTCGRSVGKTVALISILLWALINNIFPEEYIIYTVPNKAQLEPVWTGITRMLRSNSLLKHFTESKQGINSGTYTIKLLNDSTLMCRIAGMAGAGQNVFGLHSPFVLIDEGGYYPWGTWLELQPIINNWVKGSRLTVSGVPTGLRERNVLYHADEENSQFTKHRISAHENPRYTKSDEERSLEQYGGKDNDDYIHLVLGRHGKPIFSVFDRTLFDVKSYPVYKLTVDGLKYKENIGEYLERISIFPKLEHKNIIIGIDLGYTDPTAIIILYLDKTGRFRFHGRIQLNKVPYPIQQRIVDYLDTKFKPVLIGVDEGHSGKAWIQDMQMSTEFKHKNYNERMIPISFTSNIILGIDSDGKEIKGKTRPFSVRVLQDYSNNGKLIYSSTDLEMITELERMSYTRTPAGNLVYKTLTERGGHRKAQDHMTSALLCALMAWYLENESISPNYKPVELMVPMWHYSQ